MPKKKRYRKTDLGSARPGSVRPAAAPARDVPSELSPSPPSGVIALANSAVSAVNRAASPGAGASSLQTLSLCMISKDEAELLRRCLESVRDLVDEIVVVDTGSRDNTMGVAESFGARVESHAWHDDFSEARNVALELATMDWILSLDCDETIAPRDLDLLRGCLARGEVTGYQITTRNYAARSNTIGWRACDGSYPDEEKDCPGWFPSTKVRLYRRDSRIRYQGTVHEVVAPSILASGGRIADCTVPVHHYGYVEKPDRKELYLRLLERKVEEAPGHPKALFELAAAYCDAGRIADAEPVMRQVVDLIDRGSLGPELVEGFAFQSELAVSQYGWILQELGRLDEAIASYEKAIALRPDLYQALNNIGIVYEKKRDRPQALKYYLAALKMAPNDPIVKANVARTKSASRRPRLSICMIVKDGEESLPACLDSVKGLADEVVVVDTGSSDASVDVAARYGAKVHFFEWCNDFSAARNESLKHATGEWIIWLDDDDVLPESEHRKIRKAMEQGADRAFFFVLDNTGADRSQCLQLRMFPNRPGVRFSLPIHEQVTPSLAALGIRPTVTDIRVVHTGYTTDEIIAQKLRRYAQIIDGWLVVHPDDFVTRYHAGMTHYTLGEFDDATMVFRRVLDEGACRRELPHLHRSTLVFFARSLMATGKYEEALPPLEEAYAGDPAYELTAVSLAECYTHLRKHDRALGYLRTRAAGHDSPQVDFLPLDLGLVEYLRHLLLARNYEALERFEEAIGEYRTAMSLDGQRRIDAPIALFSLARRLDRNKEGIEAMQRCIAIQPDSADHRYNLGVLFLHEHRYDEAKVYFREALCRNPAKTEAYLNLGYLLKREGDLVSAEQAYRNAVEADPEFADGYANLGHLYVEMARYRDAVEAFSAVNRIQGDLLDIQIGLCAAYASPGMEDDLLRAVTDVERLMNIPLPPGEPRAHAANSLLVAAEMMLQRGLGAAAHLAVKAVLLIDRENPSALRLLARLHALDHDYWKAIELLEQLLLVSPRDPGLFDDLGKCYRALNVPQAADLCEQQARALRVLN